MAIWVKRVSKRFPRVSKGVSQEFQTGVPKRYKLLKPERVSKKVSKEFLKGFLYVSKGFQFTETGFLKNF